MGHSVTGHVLYRLPSMKRVLVMQTFMLGRNAPHGHAETLLGEISRNGRLDPTSPGTREQ